MNGNFGSISALAAEVERLEEQKDDFLVPGNRMRMVGDNRTLAIDGEGEYPLNQYAHGQLAEYLKIPRAYYDRIGSVEELRALNVNALLRKKPDERRLVRTLEGTARAVVSDKFKPLDNGLMMRAILPALQEHEVKVVSSTLTNTRMYLQVVFPKVQEQVSVGDVVQAGLTFRNSEVGAGSYEVEELIWRLWCENGAIGASVLRKVHVGRKVGELEEDYNIYRDDTIRAELESFRLRTRDVVSFAITDAGFQQTVNKMRRAKGEEIEDPVKTVERVTKKYDLSEKAGEELIAGMARDKDFSRYGLGQSITAMAKGLEDRNRQYDLEKIGFKVLTGDVKEWAELVD